MINERFQVAVINDNQTAFAIFENFSFCQIESLGKNPWWKTSPLKTGKLNFETIEDFEIFIFARGHELLPTSVVLRNYHSGNYGSGNYNHVAHIFVNPAIVIKYPPESIDYEELSEENWREESRQILHVIENGRNFVCTANIETGKGGRGCQSYEEKTWEIQEVENLPNPAQVGKRIEL